MKYEQLSDFEINKLVAKTLGIDCSGICEKLQKMYGMPVDYCNNPSQAWPIIMKSKIGITFGSQYCSAVAVRGDSLIQIVHANNPLRSAMIVFLIIKEQDDE